MDHQQYINKAVALADENVKKGGKPFGAVIVKAGKILAVGVNEVAESGDLTAHAEILVLRQAGLSGNADRLHGATLYASGHPCPMCLSAAYLAGIKEIYYATTLEMAKEAGLGVSHIYDELRKDWDDQQITLNHLPSTLQEEPLQAWQDKS